MKLFQREQRSLFGEILDWMLTPILLLWPVTLVLTWLVAQGIAGKPFDRALEFNVGALAQLITVQQGLVHFVLPQPARELLRADESDTVYYQVMGPKGEFLSGEKALPLPPDEERAPVGEVRLRDAELRGRWKCRLTAGPQHGCLARNRKIDGASCLAHRDLQEAADDEAGIVLML